MTGTMENKDFVMAFVQWQQDNQQLFNNAEDVLRNNGQDASQLTEMLNYIKQMQETINESSKHIEDIESQLAKMEDIQKHPIKNVLSNIKESLKTSLDNMKEGLKNLMSKVVEGCKKIVENGKDNLALADGKLTEIFGGVKMMEANIRDCNSMIKDGDKAIKAIETFTNEKIAKAIRNVQNAGKALAGKTSEITADTKPMEKTNAVLTAPFKALNKISEIIIKINENDIKREEHYLAKADAVKEYRQTAKDEKTVQAEIKQSLKHGDISTEKAAELREKSAGRIEAAVEKKQSLLARLDAKKDECKQANLERNKQKERAKAAPEMG